jgi:hypothetical protein
MMRKTTALCAATLTLVVSTASLAIAGVKVSGDLKLDGRIVFSDGSVQNKAATGLPGPANQLAIGSVVAGTQAGATLTGAAPNQILHLVLPEGPAGPVGPQGPSYGKLALKTVLGTSDTTMGRTVIAPINYSYDILGRRIACTQTGNMEMNPILDCDGFGSYFVQSFDQYNNPVEIIDGAAMSAEYKIEYQYGSGKINGRTVYSKSMGAFVPSYSDAYQYEADGSYSIARTYASMQQLPSYCFYLEKHTPNGLLAGVERSLNCAPDGSFSAKEVLVVSFQNDPAGSAVSSDLNFSQHDLAANTQQLLKTGKLRYVWERLP